MEYGELENRKHLFVSKKNPDFLGMVVFANAFTVTNRDAVINLFEYPIIEARFGFKNHNRQ